MVLLGADSPLETSINRAPIRQCMRQKSLGGIVYEYGIGHPFLNDWNELSKDPISAVGIIFDAQVFYGQRQPFG
jgi:hypothetical protein